MSILAVLVSWSVFFIILRHNSLLNVNLYRYVFYPLFLAILAGWLWWISKGKVSRLRKRQEKATFLATILVLWVMGYFLSGLLVNFTQNPLMSSWNLALLNSFTILFSAITLEYVRHQIVLLRGRRSPLLAGLIIVVIFTTIQSVVISFAINDAQSILHLVVGAMLPLIVYNLVQTYLAFTAGFGSMVVLAIGWSIAYSLLPIMPKYDWYMLGMSVLVLGVLIVVLFDRTRQNAKRSLKIGKKQNLAMANGMFVGVMIVLILFMTGAFNYKPMAVMSNSMKPIFNRGDMVVLRQTGEADKIEIGDVVQYNHKGVAVTHRVVRTVEEGDVIKYITKGDNSKSDDPWLVSQDMIGGVVIGRVPLIGFPTVILHEIMLGK